MSHQPESWMSSLLCYKAKAHLLMLQNPEKVANISCTIGMSKSWASVIDKKSISFESSALGLLSLLRLRSNLRALNTTTKYCCPWKKSTSSISSVCCLTKRSVEGKVFSYFEPSLSDSSAAFSFSLASSASICSFCCFSRSLCFRF